MALHSTVRVPVPDKTYRKTRNQVVYIYYYTRFYRKDGKPRNDSRQIGRLDTETGLLIPKAKQTATLSGCL